MKLFYILIVVITPFWSTFVCASSDERTISLEARLASMKREKTPEELYAVAVKLRKGEEAGDLVVLPNQISLFFFIHQFFNEAL